MNKLKNKVESNNVKKVTMVECNTNTRDMNKRNNTSPKESIFIKVNDFNFDDFLKNIKS